jgi:hypothetical protein
MLVVLDMTPSTTSYTSAALQPGQTFTVPVRNLAIRLIERGCGRLPHFQISV